MPERFTCRKGHQWVADVNQAPAATVCPTCGGAGKVLSTSLDEARLKAEAKTLPPQPVPAERVRPAQRPPKPRRNESTTAEPTVPLAPEGGGGTAPAPPIPGHTFLGVLGRGGMGVVYQAHHHASNRLVAVKMILAGFHAGPEDLARFRTEAEAASRLEHPNVVPIHEVGEAEGWPYLTMEFMEGGRLADQLDGTPWPPRRASRLVRTLARAIHHAHQRGIIHRDLKPANVLLTADGTPKIADFGLAKLVDADQGLTPSDAILGTPAYMAPEQAAGQSKRVGPAADVYALGAILYELLTGRPPFQAATRLDTILQVLNEEPVPPRLLCPKVPRALETICLKCLQKQPDQRYASARALAEDLRRFGTGGTVRAKLVRPWDAAIQWVKRNPAVALLILVLLATVAVSIVAMVWQHHNSRETEKFFLDPVPAGPRP
jgi:hypothetical protein